MNLKYIDIFLASGVSFNCGTTAVAKLVNESWHRVHAICSRYVDLAVAEADLSTATAVAIDETSCRRGHNYLTIAADAKERKVVFVTEGKDAKTITRFAEYLALHKGAPEQVRLVSIDMSPAFIKGVAEHLPNAPRHLRQVPRRRPCVRRRRSDATPRTAH